MYYQKKKKRKGLGDEAHSLESVWVEHILYIKKETWGLSILLDFAEKMG